MLRKVCCRLHVTGGDTVSDRDRTRGSPGSVSVLSTSVTVDSVQHTCGVLNFIQHSRQHLTDSSALLFAYDIYVSTHHNEHKDAAGF
jgi:hypothetical protein